MKRYVKYSGLPLDLRILFPSLRVADYPLLYPVVASTVDYDGSPVVATHLVIDKAGMNLDDPQGLLSFLSDVGYLTKSKLERLSRSVASSPGLPMTSYFEEAVTLRVANRSYLKPDEDELPVYKVWTLPLFERLSYALSHDPASILDSSLSLLHRYYTRDSTLSASMYRSVGEAVLHFDQLGFKKSFRLSGDDNSDCQVLLTYFGR